MEDICTGVAIAEIGKTKDFEEQKVAEESDELGENDVLDFELMSGKEEIGRLIDWVTPTH